MEEIMWSTYVTYMMSLSESIRYETRESGLLCVLVGVEEIAFLVQVDEDDNVSDFKTAIKSWASLIST